MPTLLRHFASQGGRYLVSVQPISAVVMLINRKTARSFIGPLIDPGWSDDDQDIVPSLNWSVSQELIL